MKEIEFKLVGTSPLLLACDVLADPLDPKSISHKELTSIKPRTEDVHKLIARSQYNGLMYWDDVLGVYMPSQNVRATLIGGGKLNKLGMQLKRGTLLIEEKIPLDYGKKLTIDQLWEQRYLDRRSVVVGKARVMAYRPKFNTWSLNFKFLYDESMLDENQILQALENAGKFVGIGGFRPEKGGTFGRFEVEKINN